jgi:uncharacterized protein YqgV (UPF0045/DUF77 family)
LTVRLEFTVEPFHRGRHGKHVAAAVEAASATGLRIDLGPFSTGVEGETEAVIAAIPRILAAAMNAGASRVSLQLTEISVALAKSAPERFAP